MKNLRGGTALLTGASGGIGRRVASALAREGMNVVVSGRREDALDSAVPRRYQRDVVAVGIDELAALGHTGARDRQPAIPGDRRVLERIAGMIQLEDRAVHSCRCWRSPWPSGSSISNGKPTCCCQNASIGSRWSVMMPTSMWFFARSTEKYSDPFF